MLFSRQQTQVGKRPYFAELDGVRALAAMMVVAFHFTLRAVPRHVFAAGQTGVDLFFVLSGFLITNILLDAPGRDWNEIGKFYIRRALRIFPLYYAFLTLATLFGVSISVWYWVYLENYPIAITPTVGLQPGHFWSLAVEEQFYLVWPFLVLFFPRRYLSWALWGMVVSALLLRIALAHTHFDPFYLTFTRIDGLAAGALLALSYYSGSLGKQRSLLWGVAALSVALAVIVGIASPHQAFDWVHPFKFTAVTGFYSACLGLLITTRATAVHALLRTRPLREIGRISYGLYVLHPPIFLLLQRVLVHASVPVLGITFAVVTYLTATLSFYGFEKRFTGMKDKLTENRRVAVLAG